MSLGIDPYLFFRGDAHAAMAFYRRVYGGELTIDTHDEGELAGQVMHASLTVRPGLRILASDIGEGMGNHNQDGRIDIAVSSTGEKDAAHLEQAWEKLSVGADVRQPLQTEPWGARLGMLVDRFGIAWMFNVGA